MRKVMLAIVLAALAAVFAVAGGGCGTTSTIKDCALASVKLCAVPCATCLAVEFQKCQAPNGK